MAEETRKDTRVELGDKVVGVIELPSIDVNEYIGKKTTVEEVTEHEGEYGYYIRVATAVVDTVGEGEDKVELRGTRVFGLQQDKEGRIGWGEKTKLAIYLKKMDVAHYRDLVGKEVTLQAQTSQKDGKDYLSFN